MPDGFAPALKLSGEEVIGRFTVRKRAMLLMALWCAGAYAQQLSDLTTPTPIPPGSVLVIGFLGGYDRWNDEQRSVRQLTLSLRERPGVYAESISNHNRPLALALIRRALDTNRDRKLQPKEKAAARIILFGQSWGGAAAVYTARDLQQRGIPVLLTVQIDSVGFRDKMIPANVREAVNFYQHDRFTIRGRTEIRAANPARTTILGNFKRSYSSRSSDESQNESSMESQEESSNQSDLSWRRKVFGRSHAKMEQDPEVWSRVEQYILDAIAGSRP